MKRLLTISALIAAPLFALMVPSVATAGGPTKVAQINGCYDCVYFDTPALQIANTTGGTMTNLSMTLLGYQGVNSGLQQTLSLSNLADGVTQTYIWGSLPGGAGGLGGYFTPHDLTSYDYDDEYAGTTNQISTSDCGYPQGCVSGGGPQYYAQPGNFQVTISATISGGIYNGQNVFSQFSPASNATGVFNGWQGLNPAGYSESPYDIHSGGFTNDLANIYLGDAPPPGVPEPAAWALMLIGFGSVGAALRRRRTAAAGTVICGRPLLCKG